MEELYLKFYICSMMQDHNPKDFIKNICPIKLTENRLYRELLQMKENNTELNIETLVLVAIWEKPFIFQGSFTITNKGDHSKKSLIFRCECNLEDKMAILEMDFSPINYKFTDLYNVQSEIALSDENYELELALYLLKYALNETLKQIITHPKQHAIHMDNIALASITQQMETYLFYRQEKNLGDSDIGFAVSIDFTPTEEIGRKPL